ncbi:acetylglutamate kinase [Oceanithermus sp.]
MLVVKIGGSLEGAGSLVQELARHDGELVLVHGGGPRIGEALASHNFETRFVDGLRVTPPEQFDIVERVLTQIGKQLADRLSRLGRLAVALSGRDARLLSAEPLAAELGRVGRVSSVSTSLLLTLLNRHLTPVVSPIAVGKDGAYNVNADEVAAAVAGCLAEPLVYFTDVPGVLSDPQDPDSRLPLLDRDEAEELIESGVISGGMIPKTTAALKALELGAPWVLIAPGGPGALAGVLSGKLGTRIVPEKIKRAV